MSQSRLIVLAAALAVAAFAPGALASPVAQAPQQTASSAPTYAVTQASVAMDSIVVQGYRFDKLPFVVALQIVKKALTRPWSNALADRNKLVCRYDESIGSHLDTMNCLTNAQHLSRYQRTQDSIWKAETSTATSMSDPGKYTTAFLNTGALYVQVGNYVANSRIKASAMQALLAKLPPANATYTLRVVNDSGQPVLDYIVRNGNLVHVYEYIYKNGEQVQVN